MPPVRSCFETARCISVETTPIHSPFVFRLYPCLVISRHVANRKPTFLYLSFVLACHVYNYSRVTTAILSLFFCICILLLLVLFLLSSFSVLIFWFSTFCISVSTFFYLCTSLLPSASFPVPCLHASESPPLFRLLSSTNYSPLSHHFHPPTYVFVSCLALVPLFPSSLPLCTVWSEWIRLESLGWLLASDSWSRQARW